MLKINLINLEASDVKYRSVSFPDGEPHITLDPFNRKESFQVITRICNPNDLYLLLQVGDILNRAGVEWELIITYCMSMRMDRVVNFEEAFSLNIVAQLINGLTPRSVRIVEPHSSRLLHLINNSRAINPMSDIMMKAMEETTPCYPDHGALERYSSFVGRDFCFCLNKTRDLTDPNSRITGMEIMYSPLQVNDTITVIDDLCDAGGTFCLAAKLLREKYPDKKLNILVTHLVNHVGLGNLCKNYDEVYVSNSYRDWDKTILNIADFPNLHVIDICKEI